MIKERNTRFDWLLFTFIAAIIVALVILLSYK